MEQTKNEMGIDILKLLNKKNRLTRYTREVCINMHTSLIVVS